MNAIIRTNGYGINPRAVLNDPWLSSLFAEAPATPEIPVDVEETGTAYIVRANVPGVTKEQIQVEIDEDVVRITAQFKREPTADAKALRVERTSGTAARSFRLPQAVDAAKAEARHVDGVLLLTLPKSAPVAKRLTIN